MMMGQQQQQHYTNDNLAQSQQQQQPHLRSNQQQSRQPSQPEQSSPPGGTSWAAKVKNTAPLSPEEAKQMISEKSKAPASNSAKAATKEDDEAAKARAATPTKAALTKGGAVAASSAAPAKETAPSLGTSKGHKGSNKAGGGNPNRARNDGGHVRASGSKGKNGVSLPSNKKYSKKQQVSEGGFNDAGAKKKGGGSGKK